MKIQAIRCADTSIYKIGACIDIITERDCHSKINENEFYIGKDDKVISRVNGNFVVSVDYIIVKPEPTPIPTQGESRG